MDEGQGHHDRRVHGRHQTGRFRDQKAEGKQHGQSAAGLINRVSRRVSKEVFRTSVLHSSLLGVTRHYIVSEITARLPVAFWEIKVL